MYPLDADQKVGGRLGYQVYFPLSSPPIVMRGSEHHVVFARKGRYLDINSKLRLPIRWEILWFESEPRAQCYFQRFALTTQVYGIQTLPFSKCPITTFSASTVFSSSSLNLVRSCK
jgi:hypothetical protein